MTQDEVIKLNIKEGDGVSALSAATISVNPSTGTFWKGQAMLARRKL